MCLFAFFVPQIPMVDLIGDFIVVWILQILSCSWKNMRDPVVNSTGQKWDDVRGYTERKTYVAFETIVCVDGRLRRL